MSDPQAQNLGEQGPGTQSPGAQSPGAQTSGDQSQDDQRESQNEDAGVAVGDRVSLAQSPPYLKTADAMPMLRPPDLISLEDEGLVIEQRPGQTWVVKFDRGSFLIDTPYLRKLG